MCSNSWNDIKAKLYKIGIWNFATKYANETIKNLLLFNYHNQTASHLCGSTRRKGTHNVVQTVQWVVHISKRDQVTLYLRCVHVWFQYDVLQMYFNTNSISSCSSKA